MTAVGSWSPIPEGWCGLPFTGTLPPTLYRYRSLGDALIEKRLDEVLNGVVFLAGANSLNDPDEGRVRWTVQGSPETAFEVVLGALQAANCNADPGDLIVKAGDYRTSHSR